MPYFVKVVGLPVNDWEGLLNTVLKPLKPKIYEREVYIALALDSKEEAEKTVKLLNGHKQENLILRAVHLVTEGENDWKHETFNIREDFKVELDEDEIDTAALERELEAKYPPLEGDKTYMDEDETEPATDEVLSESQDSATSSKK